MGRLYRTLRAVYCALTRRYRTEWAVPFIDEPCIFIVNHAGAFGPLAMTTRFPFRDRQWLWCSAGILDRKTCPDYIRGDSWWPPESRLAGFYSRVIPPAVSLILPPVLRSAPTIPVWRDARITKTFRLSIEKMREGSHIVIFPERVDGFASHAEEIHTGWMTLCPLAQARLGGTVRIWPVHMDHRRRVFSVAAPVVWDPSRTPDEQRAEVAEKVTRGLRGIADD